MPMDDLSHPEREGSIPNDGPLAGPPGPSVDVDRSPRSRYRLGTCPDCGGTGEEGNTVCPTCQGTGSVAGRGGG
jgi:hypothetical protein